MKKILWVLIALSFMTGHAQTVDDSGDLQTSSQKYVKTKSASGRLQGWKITGKNSLQFNQAAFSDWIAGGVNSYALTGNLDYEFNYTNGRHIWDNRLILNYGVLKNQGEGYRKSNDVIDLTSSYGYEFQRNWYFAASANLQTQFAPGYDYDDQDPVTDKYKKISNFMAPGYLSFGLGVDYKPNENFQINIHPFTSRFVFVLDKDLQQEGNFGLKHDGDSFLYEFGAYVGGRYKFNLAKNVSFDNRIGIYSNYLKKPENLDLAYKGILDMAINSFMSAQASVNLFYNENQIKKVQVKQTLGVGVVYNFDNVSKLRSMPENQPTVEELQEAMEAAQKEADKANEKAEAARQKWEEAENEITD